MMFELPNRVQFEFRDELREADVVGVIPDAKHPNPSERVFRLEGGLRVLESEATPLVG